MHLPLNSMTNKLIASISLLGFMSIWIHPYQVSAQLPSKAIQSNPSSYEDDRIKVVVQDCTRKLQDLICQATLTSKNSDRTVDLNSNTIKLVDPEGNEYNPTSIRLANRVSENNSIRTELVENIPFKASFVFGKVPANFTQVALLQISLGGGVIATAKFRNVTVLDRASTATNPVKIPVATVAPTSVTKTAKVVRVASSDNTSVCPDNTKVLYRATSKDYLLYICGAKSPTHYVGLSKDGTQGITLRLRYYDRSQFSADNGDTNYTIAANRLVIRKNSKVIYQDKIQIVQPLTGTAVAEDTPPKTKPRKNSALTTSGNQKRSSTSQQAPKIKRQPTTEE
jgi:hypothetical protein